MVLSDGLANQALMKSECASETSRTSFQRRIYGYKHWTRGPFDGLIRKGHQALFEEDMYGKQ